MVSSMNIRMIQEQYKRGTGRRCLEKNVDILVIQEERIVHNKPNRCENVHGATLIATTV